MTARPSPSSAPATTSASWPCSTAGPARPRSRPRPTSSLLVLGQREFLSLLEEVPGPEPQDADHPGRAGPRARRAPLRLMRVAPRGARLQSRACAASTFSDRMSAKFGTARKIILGIGIGFAVVTVLSGLSGWVFASSQVDHSVNNREVFGGIPNALVKSASTSSSRSCWSTARCCSPSAPRTGSGAAPTTGPPPRRTSAAPARTSGPAPTCRPCCATRPPASCTRSSTSASWCCWPSPRCSRSTTSCPTSLKFLHGDVYEGYSLVATRPGSRSSIGVVWAIVRRYVQRPYRIRIKTKPEHAVILGMFLSFGVTGFLTEGYRIAVDGAARVREVVASSATRCRGLVKNTHHLAGWHQVVVDRPRGHLLRLPGDPVRPRCCATCSRRR